MFFLLKKLTIF